MSGRDGIQILRALLLTAVAGETGRRILTPRPPLTAPVPVDIRDHFSEAEIARGRAFSRPQRRIGRARSALATGLLVTCVRRSPAPLTHRRVNPVADTALAGAVLSLGFAAPGLPLRVIARRRAIAFGLDTQSWRGWAADLGKAAAIETLFSGALAGGAALISARYREHWWRAAALAMVAIGALAGGLAPVLLDPIFNDFDPLPEGETRSDVLALADAAGVDVGEVYAVDASRRTTAANAYVTGLGPTKRVVIYDTLLDRYDRDEVRLVVAHELGHMRHRDVMRGVAFAAILAGPLCWATQQVTATLAGGDPGAPVNGVALPALALAAGIVSLPLSPIAAALSRAMERRADDFSLRLAGAPEAFISFDAKPRCRTCPTWSRDFSLARWPAIRPPGTGSPRHSASPIASRSPARPRRSSGRRSRRRWPPRSGRSPRGRHLARSRDRSPGRASRG